MVLSACSTYFEQLFLEHPEPNPIVIMRETSFTDLAIIVEFMYKGEINVSQVRPFLFFFVVWNLMAPSSEKNLVRLAKKIVQTA